MNDEYYMRQALREAQKAFDDDEVPIGAIVVWNDKIIARGYNQTERLQDCTAHAEMIALTAAFNAASTKYLPEATLYVTIEPCLMCSGALYWSKIGRIVYGGADEKNGYKHYFDHQDAFTPMSLKTPFHPKTRISHGILQDECIDLVKLFFAKKRG